MVLYEKSYLKVAEFFFNEQEAETRADIVRYQFRPAPIDGCDSSDYYTLVCDLSEDQDALLGRMYKVTRYEIRRAEKESLTYEAAALPDAEWMEQFFSHYDQFAQGKGLVPANRTRIGAFRRHGALDLSRILAADGRALVWHAFIRTPNRARLLHSASLHRGLSKHEAGAVSRANRLQHWLDMRRFKAAGTALYDFGGWYLGESDTEKIRINQFKESFGGERVHEYNADRATTWKGMAALTVHNAVQAWSRRKC